VKALPPSRRQRPSSRPLPGRDEVGSPFRRLGEVVDAIGEGAALLGHSLWAARRLDPLSGTLLTQAALVTTTAIAAIVVVSTAAGASCGVESVAITRQLGARGAVGGLTVFCTLREAVPLVFGYVLALTVGCALVTDLGAGDGNDTPRRAAPRVAGVLLVFPFAYLLTLACTTAGAVAIGIGRYGEVGPGTFLGLFIAFQDSTDLAFSVAKSLAMAVFVLAAALVYGSRAAAGSEAIPNATARFALVAILGVTLLGALITLLLYGANPRIPAG
jgi:phospholipid/cholesterol/gamma-HCH transport system permease protein